MKVLFVDVESENSKIQEMEVEFLNCHHGADICEMQVLKSAAGYYIGGLSEADWYDGPGSYWQPEYRDSDCYWPTREEAEEALKTRKYPVKF